MTLKSPTSRAGQQLAVANREWRLAINGWNRLAISFRSVPGSYQGSSAMPEASAAGNG